jgi:hypothetical protein
VTPTVPAIIRYYYCQTENSKIPYTSYHVYIFQTKRNKILAGKFRGKKKLYLHLMLKFTDAYSTSVWYETSSGHKIP